MSLARPNLELIPALAYTPSHTQDGHAVQLYANDELSN